MDPQLQTLGITLAEAAVRNTAATVATRITTAKTARQKDQTIAALEEIINELIADKIELIRVAQAYEQTLAGQRISQVEIEYVTGNLIPAIKRMLETAAPATRTAEVAQVVDVVETLLSVEMISVLQLIGLNLRAAIGQPLTELIAGFITSKNPNRSEELQMLERQRELAYLNIAMDEAAHDR